MMLERLKEVRQYETAVVEQKNRLAIGLRFHLRDGTNVSFAVPLALANTLILDLQKQLNAASRQPPTTKKH